MWLELTHGANHPPLRIGNILSFIEHGIALSATCNTPTITKNHVLVHAQWYGDHPRRDYLQYFELCA